MPQLSILDTMLTNSRHCGAARNPKTARRPSTSTIRRVHLNHLRTGEGPPLVLIHGIGSQWQMWSPVLAQLRAHHELIALDLPGFGASPMPPPETEPGADSLASLVAEFLAEEGIERPHVAGNSLGGWIALELARRSAARSATALSPAGFHDGWEASYQRAMLRASVASARMTAAHAETIVATTLGRRLALSLFFARPERLSAAQAAQGIRALAGAQWFDETLPAIIEHTFTGGERIDVPVTIAWGAEDRLLLPRQARRAARAVPAAKLVMLDGCGHVPTYDDPEQVARVLLEGCSE